MPLIPETLKLDIKAAYDEVKNYGTEDPPKNGDDAIEFLATKITEAIDKYLKSATVTVPAGIPVATAGTAAAQTGATTAPGLGTIS